MTISDLCSLSLSCRDCEFYGACIYTNDELFGRQLYDLDEKTDERITKVIIKTARRLEDKEKIIKLKDRTLTNKEWVDLLQRNFNVSRTVAKEMLHGIMTVKQYDNFKKQFIH